MKILLDMDGVLVDFVKGLCTFHNKPYPFTPGVQGSWDLEPILKMSSKDLWSPLGYDFWAGLDPYSYMEEYLNLLETKFGRENICLLTSPPKSVGAVEGKIAFIEKYLPNYTNRFLVGPAKEFCAAPNHLLIDDYIENIEKFRKAGGQTFLVPGAWNTKFNENPLESLKEFLNSLNSL